MTETNKEYSKALFMLATEDNCVEEYVKALKTVKSLIDENDGYCEMLASPSLLLSERLSAVDEAFGKYLPENIVSFVKLLVETRHIKELDLFIDEFFELVRKSENRTTATIFSAVELDDKQKEKLCLKLEKTYGKKIDAVYIVDKKLLGGIKVSIDGNTIDGSIEKRLEKVSRSVKGVING